MGHVPKYVAEHVYKVVHPGVGHFPVIFHHWAKIPTNSVMRIHRII